MSYLLKDFFNILFRNFFLGKPLKSGIFCFEKFVHFHQVSPKQQKTGLAKFRLLHVIYMFYLCFQSFDGNVLSNHQDGRKWNQACVRMKLFYRLFVQVCANMVMTK